MTSVRIFYEQALAQHKANRLEEAVAGYGAALALKPDFAEALYNRGVALWALGRLEEALASTERASALTPRHFETLYNRGALLQRLRRPQEALQSFDAALALRPGDVKALNNRAGMLQELGRLDEALATCERALALEPDQAGLHYNRGTVLRLLGRHAESLTSYEQALALDPGNLDALGRVAGRALQLCDWTRVESLTGPLTAKVAEGKAVVAPHIFLGYSDDPALQLICAQAYIRDKIGVAPPHLWKGERYSHDKIRIAYLSADFHQHATAYLTAELFERHDRARFEVTALSFGEDDGSPMRARLVKAFDRFVDVSGKSDLESATLLRGLEIDIAVDLKGHTQGSRPEILGHRPAPVQVNYLGYPGSMGADFIDYVIADRIVLPFDQQPFYAEHIVHLPGCYQVNDTRRAIAPATPSRRELGLPESGFVFCCFNNCWKISAPLFEIWMRLLKAVPGSVLWLLGDNDDAARNLRREAAARSIDPGRLIFAPRLSLEAHLARHRRADLFLDTFPVNAHTTASDALWAGLPLVTCSGRSFVSRVAASLLAATDMGELATADLAAYEKLALALAQDPARLAAIRQRLGRDRTTLPLFDPQTLCRHIEAAYTQMHAIAAQGQKPKSFAVQN
jgi:protein O-GlcNAc transferase